MKTENELLEILETIQKRYSSSSGGYDPGHGRARDNNTLAYEAGEKLRKINGVILDDIVAGIYTIITLALINVFV